MRAGSPQPLLIEVYANRNAKGVFRDEARVAVCTFPSSLTTGAAFARTKEFIERYRAASDVEDTQLRVVKAFVDMGTAVGTRAKSVTTLKRITPGYVQTFPQGVPVEGNGFSEGTIEVTDQGMDRAEVGVDGVIRIDLRKEKVVFDAVERLCATKDASRLFPNLEQIPADESMLEFSFDENEEVRKRWFSGRSGQTAFVIGDSLYNPID